MEGFGIVDLFKLGFHYGHRRWRSSPKMLPFIFCEKWGVHIIDLCKTLPMMEKALSALKATAAKGGKILFVGTKNQAKGIVEEIANACGQPYVNQRWLGGTMTNWQTIRSSIDKLRKMEEEEASGYIEKFAKNERLEFKKKKDKLLKFIGGIREMGGIPDFLVVVDTKREMTSIQEARVLKIPVVALADTDSPSPEDVSFLVPGNDDGVSSIKFFLEKCQEAILEGKSEIKLVKKEKTEKEKQELRTQNES